MYALEKFKFQDFSQNSDLLPKYWPLFLFDLVLWYFCVYIQKNHENWGKRMNFLTGLCQDDVIEVKYLYQEISSTFMCRRDCWRRHNMNFWNFSWFRSFSMHRMINNFLLRSRIFVESRNCQELIILVVKLSFLVSLFREPRNISFDSNSVRQKIGFVKNRFRQIQLEFRFSFLRFELFCFVKKFIKWDFRQPAFSSDTILAKKFDLFIIIIIIIIITNIYVPSR